MPRRKRPTIGEEILQGAREALAAVRGDKTAVRVHHIPRIDVRKVRTGLHLNQAQFAARFGFSVDSVQNWEQGRRIPDGPARVLLTVIAHEPEAVERALQSAAG
jgi:putative transcriptional regulator